MKKAIMAAFTLILALTAAGCGSTEEWEPFLTALDAYITGESAAPEISDAPSAEEASPEVPPEEPSSGAPAPSPALPEEVPAEQPEILPEEVPAAAVLYYAEPADPMAGGMEEYLPSIAFYPEEGVFYLVCNLLEGMGGISGTYEETDSAFVCTVESIDFKGFSGDDTQAFTMEKAGNALIWADDILIGYTRQGSVFEFSGEMPASYAAFSEWARE